MNAKDVIKGIEGKALDWALNYALMLENGFVPEIAGAAGAPSELYSHTDPAVCLWLIKEYRASIDQVEHDPRVEVHIWFALTDEADPDFDCQSVIGDTVEQAVARCVVQMRLGDEVEVPSELREVQP